MTKTPKMASSKLDIWELLRNIDDNNVEFINNLPDDQKGGFVPIVTLRWLSGSGNDVQLMNLNEIVNSTVFSLYKHPSLLYRLMVTSTPPGRKQYNWIKRHKRAVKNKRIDVVKRYLSVSTRHAEEYAPLYTTEEILEMAEALGDTKEAIKLLKSELK